MMISIKTALYRSSPLLAAFVFSAHADDDTAAQNAFTLGIGGQYAPRYSGSDKQRLQMVPVIQARWNALFFDSQKGLGYDLQADNGLYFEHTLGYGLGRADSNSGWRDGANNLKGMGNIDATLNTAMAVGWSITPWLNIEGKATLPLTDGQGVQYQTSLALIPLQTASDTLAFQSAALFGDSRYMNTFYGVNRAQSLRSGYARYAAASGFYGVNSDLTWNHQFDEHWGAMISVGYSWLSDHAADSPLVQRRNEGSGVLAILYTF
ncbi:Outer membrane scaffolding protein for murein synthesis, MipA/OmpV family [Kosakonia oryzae]|uniref:Outer membrane scaffolding protein for murein synthesis, MipA/OmpV family n=2 Tax=Kosakonia oryzae TaxID=497725 RepID=A0AA94H4C9_9ENTR|nr:Outer membrane scaffolding protein for murein synthesis, MipA/OmpV family [Kosakonia oryzae]